MNYYVCGCVFNLRVYSLLPAYLWRKIRITSSSQYQFNSEFVYSFMELLLRPSKRQSRPLFFKWVKAHTWLSSNNFPKGLLFLVSLTSEMTTQNHRMCLVRLHLHFPWLPWDFAVMKTILWCNALWITGDAISVLPVNS